MTRLLALNRFYAPDESATAQLLTDLCEHLARQGRPPERADRHHLGGSMS